ncbi:alpha/beta hydrolase [Chondromyces apiculatus]|uniref:Soluble epoxide hydrolase n=1 Tax=Chondromyces apiculatus DSM 436 TaxID=1192034 RepID=A0A017TDR1_9BACT|nr:alpha/beta fold hydrolase [Chondromyces apiculatus]EYF06746.1 Soluble epoxide hydrolase [Chondromyces apiculatus DSM 436]
MTARRPEDYLHHEAQLDGIRIHYVREGRQGRLPLVLLHGWPGFWWEWHRNIGPLAEHFDVIVPDLRGHGDSEKPDLSCVDLFRIDHVVDDITALLDHLDLARVCLVGQDWAALAVHKLVRRHRGRVIRAAVLNPITPGLDVRAFRCTCTLDDPHPQGGAKLPAVALGDLEGMACRSFFEHYLCTGSRDGRQLQGEERQIYVDNFLKPGNIQGGLNYYRANFGGGGAAWDSAGRVASDCPITFFMNQPVPSGWHDLVSHWYTRYRIEHLPGHGRHAVREHAEHVSRRLREVLLSKASDRPGSQRTSALPPQ